MDNEVYLFKADGATNVCHTLHDITHAHYFFKWKACTAQGISGTALSLSKRSNELVLNGKLPTPDWKFAIRARNYLLPLRYSAHILGQRDMLGVPLPTCCRRCNYDRETQSHVLNKCPYNKALWCLRHDTILDLTVQCLKSNGIECLVESPYPGVEFQLQPDLIITNNRRRMITILDRDVATA